MAYKTLLLLDDEEAHRLFAARACRAQWPLFTLLEAGSLDDARKQIQEHGRNLTVFIIDFNLGQDSGITLVKQIRNDPMLSSRPVLVVSTSELPADIEAAYMAGASAFIFKGLDLTLYSQNLVGAIKFFMM